MANAVKKKDVLHQEESRDKQHFLRLEIKPSAYQSPSFTSQIRQSRELSVKWRKKITLIVFHNSTSAYFSLDITAVV